MSSLIILLLITIVVFLDLCKGSNSEFFKYLWFLQIAARVPKKERLNDVLTCGKKETFKPSNTYHNHALLRN